MSNNSDPYVFGRNEGVMMMLMGLSRQEEIDGQPSKEWTINKLNELGMSRYIESILAEYY